MSTKKVNTSEIILQSTALIDESVLFENVSTIIENRKYRIQASVNSEATLMFWEVGQYINTIVLADRRAEYGKKILTTLSSKLRLKYGSSFSERNLYRMMLFSERFADYEIVATLSPQLSWSHITELIRIKTHEARLYYAKLCVEKRLNIRELRHLISRKAYERGEIANTQLTESSKVPFNVF